MDRTADLDSALSFVIGRIAEQATVSGKPLSDEQRLLLNYLPSETPANWDPEFPVLVPRNINLERVCALGKAAYLHDRQLNPSSLDWEFAFAVFTLNLPLMGFLVNRAGIKLCRKRLSGLQLLATDLLLLSATHTHLIL